MRKILMLSFVLLAFCSCGKDYPQMVRDKVEHYKSEGKVILNCSDDATGREHYIVYGDVESQTICVDTLGEQVEVFSLGRKTVKTLTPSVKEEDGLSVDFEEQKYGDAAEQRDYRLSKDGKILRDGQPVEMSVYKDKNIMLGEWPDVIFLGKNDAYYNLGGTCKIGEDGNLKVTINVLLGSILPEAWVDYISNSEVCPELYVDRYHDDFSYKVELSPQGKIVKKADVANCAGVLIPVEAFEDWSALRRYIQRIVADN